MRRIRCAIYTRKSSEDGLEQDFNSLDAQREACEAYIASQRHEGWELLPDRFDDGGISGGHMDRPGLQRLMDQVDAKQVDQIVVYKIDRLTRSLADFAKLVDRLDAAGASFVSVTQSFNTSTSMGRLTLNVLLSFAQFEREVTAERIRDKIAASKRKGLWMGGNVPLGYVPEGRILVIHPEEAKIVRRIYDLYEDHGSITKLREAAEDLGLRSKPRGGTKTGGQIMSRGHLHHILTNPIYAGRIPHKGEVFDGQHQAIIDPERWDRLQTQLSSKAAKARRSKHHRDPSPLAGKLFDAAGEKLTPSHSKKGARRYRYYISKRLVTGVTRADEKQRTWRIPAAQLEEPIAQAMRDKLDELRAQVNDQVLTQGRPDTIAAADLFDAIESVTIDQGAISVRVNRAKIAEMLEQPNPEAAPDLTLTLPFAERRRGAEMKLVIAGPSAVDHALIRNIALANHWYARVKQGASLSDLAAETGTNKRRIQQMIHLVFLPPDVVRDALQGIQPIGLTSDWFLRHALPLDREAQRGRISALA